MKNKLKLLEVCPFSAGICGVWARVKSESQEFAKLGFEVRIFSSDIEKGTLKKACNQESLGELLIQRFPAKKSLFSENVFLFNFKKAFEEYAPDIVITHLLHPHSFQVLNFCLSRKIPCYLVTHAPFNVKRKFPLNLVSRIYNFFKVKPKIQAFSKVISITRWEIPYLYDLGLKKENIIYIPNGLSEEYFSIKPSKKSNSKEVLFLGRIAPIKNLEILLKVAKILPEVNFSIVGSAEKDYLSNLKEIISREKISNVSFYNPIFNLREKIETLDKHKILILPSKREAMPLVLLEALARGKVVIASKTDGAKEIIQDSKNGFLYDSWDFKRLAEILKKNLKVNNKLSSSAKNSAEKYSWKKLIKAYPFVINR